MIDVFFSSADFYFEPIIQPKHSLYFEAGAVRVWDSVSGVANVWVVGCVGHRRGWRGGELKGAFHEEVRKLSRRDSGAGAVDGETAAVRGAKEGGWRMGQMSEGEFEGGAGRGCEFRVGIGGS